MNFLQISQSIPGLRPDILFSIGGLPITNTMTLTWLVVGLFLLFGILLKNKLEKKVGLKKTKVIIGGYVAMDESSETIGAEHYCKNITHTISLLKTLASEGDDMQFTQIR